MQAQHKDEKQLLFFLPNTMISGLVGGLTAMSIDIRSSGITSTFFFTSTTTGSMSARIILLMFPWISNIYVPFKLFLVLRDGVVIGVIQGFPAMCLIAASLFFI